MRSFIRAAVVLALTIPLILLISATPAHADAVTSMDDPLYQRVNPTTNVDLVTPWWDEATTAASQYGYSTNLGTPFKASTTAQSGLSAVHRLWNASTVDFTDALEGSAAYTSATSAGYVDQGLRFYALATAVSGRTEPVNSYVKSGKHRLATATTGASLVSSGWTLDGVAFNMPSTSAPTPTPTPTPTATATPTPTPTPTAGTAGSVTVGSASYSAPANAVYVSPSGDDNSAGTLGAPVRTINQGLAKAPTWRHDRRPRRHLPRDRHHQQDRDHAELPERSRLAGRVAAASPAGSRTAPLGARTAGRPAVRPLPHLHPGRRRQQHSVLAVRQHRHLPDGGAPRPGVHRRGGAAAGQVEVAGHRRHLLPRRVDIEALPGQRTRADGRGATPAPSSRR